MKKKSANYLAEGSLQPLAPELDPTMMPDGSCLSIKVFFVRPVDGKEKIYEQRAFNFHFDRLRLHAGDPKDYPLISDLFDRWNVGLELVVNLDKDQDIFDE